MSLPELGNEKPQQQRSKMSAETIVRLITAVLGLTAVVLGLTTKLPTSTTWLVRITLLFLVIVGISFLGRIARQVLKGRRHRQFIVAETRNLKALVSQLEKFIDPNQMRALMYIMRSAYSNNFDAIGKVLAVDYIGTWLDCFKEQLRTDPPSLGAFILRCREFTLIVSDFNRNYVHRANKELAAAHLRQDYIEQLEEMRDEFHYLLRRTEEWARVIIDYGKENLPEGEAQLWRYAPVNHFDRVKSFGHSVAVVP